MKKLSILLLAFGLIFNSCERELDIKHDDAANAVISIDNTIRKELFFDFIECNAEIKKHSISDRDIKNKIGTINFILLLKLEVLIWLETIL